METHVQSECSTHRGIKELIIRNQSVIIVSVPGEEKKDFGDEDPDPQYVGVIPWSLCVKKTSLQREHYASFRKNNVTSI